jgi:mRNA-degrading endonuclease YafQ of YafQ-DinJ toxin-antitoxin module
LRSWLKVHPETARDIESALKAISHDDADPSLKIHKLRGPLSGCWACSAGYDLRIVFDYVEVDTEKMIRLLTLGTHDQVY